MASPVVRGLIQFVKEAADKVQYYERPADGVTVCCCVKYQQAVREFVAKVRTHEEVILRNLTNPSSDDDIPTQKDFLLFFEVSSTIYQEFEYVEALLATLPMVPRCSEKKDQHHKDINHLIDHMNIIQKHIHHLHYKIQHSLFPFDQ